MEVFDGDGFLLQEHRANLDSNCLVVKLNLEDFNRVWNKVSTSLFENPIHSYWNYGVSENTTVEFAREIAESLGLTVNNKDLAEPFISKLKRENSSLIGVYDVQLNIETKILKPDPNAGVKSLQKIHIDFQNKKVIQASVFTGVSDIGVAELNSIRDDFKVEVKEINSDVVRFRASGKTASGVIVLPDIDYSFEFLSLIHI